ncbi:MAG TPA: alpha/beta hydrolase [Armatimonadota bacterium]|nr:alpha/beta hydrolase [Armatimonadota bacterium]
MARSRLLLTFLSLGLLAFAGLRPACAAGASLTLPVWPGQPPGETAPLGEEKDMTKPEDGKIAGKRLIRLGNVSRPVLAVFRPERAKDTGAAVVIAPGGGYSILAWDLEGEEVAAWLNSIGVTGVVLKYRVPRRPDQPKDKPPVTALQDAQRAVSLVRSKAKEWGLDPARIGMLGFSAGGHLAAWTATNPDQRAYSAVDEVDRVSCRPDFLVLVYPAYLANKEGTGLMPEIRVSKDTPPTFFAHAANDPVTAENSALMFLALKRAGVPAELHIYNSGGHGFGLRRTEEPCTTWPARCEEWLRARGVLQASGR